MPSYYDEARNCRVGTMDEDQFYRESDPVNAAYFEELLARWTSEAGQLKWGAGGVGLRVAVEAKDVGICFLAPAFGNKKDRVELSLTPLAKRIGAEACAELKDRYCQLEPPAPILTTISCESRKSEPLHLVVVLGHSCSS